MAKSNFTITLTIHEKRGLARILGLWLIGLLPNALGRRILRIKPVFNFFFDMEVVRE
jgi:hypothetical protein